METPMPRARRLNRRAAIAAALVAGAMILVVGALVTSTPKIAGGEATGLPGEAAPQSPTFLERAPVPPPLDEDAELAALLGGAPPAPDPAPPSPGAWVNPGVDPYAGAYASAPAPSLPDPRAEARERALSAGILAPRDRGEAPATPSDGGEGALGTTARGAGGRAARLPARLLAAEAWTPGPGYEIPAGTLLHAVLVSAVDSDAPGDAVAMLTHDVYDRSMREVLIPRTSRLIGRPSGSPGMGQRRLSMIWDRLVLPDGRTVLLPEIPSQDAAGAGAHAARVDAHTGAVLRNALLLSLVGAGAQLSQPQQSASWGQAPSVGQTVAGATGAQLAQVSGEMIRRGMDLRPTLSLPQGTPLNLLLTADLALEPYR